MFKMLFVFVVLIVGFIGGILMAYDVQFHVAPYDILATARVDHKKGYGINYKGTFEVWKFEQKFLGVDRKKIFP